MQLCRARESWYTTGSRDAISYIVYPRLILFTFTTRDITLEFVLVKDFFGHYLIDWLIDCFGFSSNLSLFITRKWFVHGIDEPVGEWLESFISSFASVPPTYVVSLFPYVYNKFIGNHVISSNILPFSVCAMGKLILIFHPNR